MQRAAWNSLIIAFWTTIIAVVLGIVVGIAGVWTARWVHGQVHPAGPHGAPVQFTIEQGQATNTVANNLAAQKVIGNATVFRYWLRRQGGEQTFKDLCSQCHGLDATGAMKPDNSGKLAPALANNPRVNGHRDWVLSVLVNGLTGPIPDFL